MHHQLSDILLGQETRLLEILIQSSRETGYMPYSAPFQEAWVASLRGLSASLTAMLEENRAATPVTADYDSSRDPVALYGIEAAKRHRARGVRLGMFLGLLKRYRAAYVDLVREQRLDPGTAELYRDTIENFFDRVEIGLCDEWTSHTDEEFIRLLQSNNRLLTEEKAKYLTIYESLKNPVILLDAEGMVENMNFAAARLFSDKTAPGKAAPGAAYYGKHRQITLERLLGRNISLDDPDAMAGERKIDTNFGPRWFEVKVQKTLDNSERFVGTVIILSDVTEYREARDAAYAADRAKSSFLATMSHEVRTPLHGIIGLAELIERAALPTADRERLDAIARSGELLLSVVNDILDYSKIEAGVIDYERIEFCVPDVVGDVLALMEPLAARKPGLALTAEVVAPPRVIGDPGKLRQILLNLVGNAIKFTDSGSVEVTVTETPSPSGRQDLCFTVRDSGIGIPSDKLGAIFDPFVQADGSVIRTRGGSGLGLTICRRLVDMIGGRLTVTSTPGQGSEFAVHLPFVIAPIAGASRPMPEHAPAASGDAPLPARPRSSARGRTILVVEDNEVNALVITGMLERDGYDLVIVERGDQALAVLESRSFDAVFTDIRLPGMTGLDLARRIRAMGAQRTAALPIVVLSAQILPSDIREGREAGIATFLRKPFHSADLHRVLTAIFDGGTATAARQKAPTEPPLYEQAHDLGMDSARRVLDTYCATAPRMIDDLAAALEAADGERSRAIAHRLKGSSAHVGCTDLETLAVDIGRAVRRGETLDLSARVGAIRGLLPHVLVALKQRFERDCGAS